MKNFLTDVLLAICDFTFATVVALGIIAGLVMVAQFT